MDAGIAALLGTGLGSIATLGAAVLSGHLQSRSQHEQASRLHRRDAYTKYLGALHDRDIAMDAILGALQPGASRPDAVDEKVSHFIALAREVHRAAEVVILEGPRHVIEAAEQITHASADLSEVMQRMVENARSGNDVQHEADSALAAEREHRLYQSVQNFRATAREALGNAEQHTR
ncbi:proline dehydrogenase [Streptomyces sp. HNM0575]|uniref:proline dehydrogenase n=1 Tax=Streptomyces sp. HNM0575 TaxID=2716338 RepID=UPI00145DC28D|nr:proline dehydrogenase [Streptomyces sp. HNM0575]NLU75095.1 proline dehydrogenase [Streptomyces sp. HNM0575]